MTSSIKENRSDSFKCKRCGHKWRARVKKPAVCPRCKRYDWNEDKK